MNVTFRVDSSFQIGTGHVMRCLTLANVLRLMGAKCRFICRDLSGHVAHLIVGNGYPVDLLPANSSVSPGSVTPSGYQAWLGCSVERDAHQVQAVLGGQIIDWLVVDHYALDERWELALCNHYGKLLVIDDLADRSHRCDVLLDSNEYINAPIRYSALVPPTAHMLLGTNYALLRPEFLTGRTRAAPYERRKRLFIGFGGADKDNQTLASLRAAHSLCAAGIGCDIVVGASYPFVEQLRSKLEAYQYPDVQLHVSTEEIAFLMGQARMAICGGGGSTWERLCIGLPSLVIATAENQMEALMYLHELSMIRFLGADKQLTDSQLADAIRDLWLDDSALHAMHRRGMALVDGEGTARVAKMMEEFVL